MTDNQRRVLDAVSAASKTGVWYRAKGHGERVTLASLYYKGLLERRAWRGKAGDPDAANEYTIASGGLAR